MSAADTNTKILSTNLFPVVGIGASAGGLDAFKRFIQNITLNSGMAYVLVQHLDPKHESILPELLQKVSRIPVSQITDEVKVKPDHIYIIPSNKMLEANNGVLELSPRKHDKSSLNLPIDLFFASLAEVHQSHAIGVVLSGTASDGTRGLRSIKEHGGITFAQEPESATFDAMPKNAIQAGVVDFILTPEQIPLKLLELTGTIYKSDDELHNLPVENFEIFRQILALLRVRKKNDFTWYKQTTIRRRILRRMAISRIGTPAEYLQFLKENKPEQDALYDDFLIGVTSFFRDRKIFDRICQNVLPAIFREKPASEPVRIWVAGCSTGQEAYSFAICLKMILNDAIESGTLSVEQAEGKVQIFASDINEAAIAKSRLGIYPDHELEGLTKQNLSEFFMRSGNTWQVKKNIRDLCVFAVHNVLKDPPFGKMDLVSCRNVLIYMEANLQKKALSSFHYSLNPDGLLLLGKSETSISAPKLFSSFSKSDKIFKKKAASGRFMLLPGQINEQTFREVDVSQRSVKENVRTDFQKAIDDAILSRYQTAGVLINDEMEIVHFRGNTRPYLEQTSGKPSHNLLKMAKDGLSFELRNIIHKTKKDKVSAIKENIPVRIDGLLHNISIESIPLSRLAEPHYLVLFHNKPSEKEVIVAGHGIKAEIRRKEAEDNLLILQLEQELAQTREDMRGISEDQEAFNEELQSANEELQSGSEELQSLNEELETSKEELQSTNEELIVVNQELSDSNEQLKEERNFARAIIATIREPLLVLDRHWKIRTANTNFYSFFGLKEAETTGRLIFDIGDNQWDFPQLRNLLQQVIPEKNSLVDFEVEHDFPFIGRKTILLNAREIERGSDDEKLILLAFEDITEKKDLANRALKNQELREKEMEEKVKERTAALKEANELLLKKNRELESFTYISSHDLQEPLRKIQMFSGSILEQEEPNLSESGKGYFHRMRLAANRMQNLLEDLLAYSRVLEKAELIRSDVNNLIQEVEHDLREEIAQKQAEIHLPENGSVFVIPFQFRQLLHNLVSNSLKFSETGIRPQIIIKNEIVSGADFVDSGLNPSKNYNHISYSDNSMGFDPQYNELVFRVFQRLHDSSKYPGTGMGLSIVKRVVENHNGFISVNSKPGQGLTYDIFIPSL